MALVYVFVDLRCGLVKNCLNFMCTKNVHYKIDINRSKYLEQAPKKLIHDGPLMAINDRNISMYQIDVESIDEYQVWCESIHFCSNIYFCTWDSLEL